MCITHNVCVNPAMPLGLPLAQVVERFCYDILTASKGKHTINIMRDVWGSLRYWIVSCFLLFVYQGEDSPDVVIQDTILGLHNCR